MIIVWKVVEAGLQAEARRVLFVDGHREGAVVVHGDAQAAAVDEELPDDVSPLCLLLVAGHKRGESAMWQHYIDIT